jgi:hypothetical protein
MTTEGRSGARRWWLVYAAFIVLSLAFGLVLRDVAFVLVGVGFVLLAASRRINMAGRASSRLRTLAVIALWAAALALFSAVIFFF